MFSFNGFQVSQVGYDDSQVTVMLSSGETLNATRVIVTLPLALLQRRAVFFEPTLPQKKIRAIDGLGAGIIEKVRVTSPSSQVHELFVTKGLLKGLSLVRVLMHIEAVKLPAGGASVPVSVLGAAHGRR